MPISEWQPNVLPAQVAAQAVSAARDGQAFKGYRACAPPYSYDPRASTYRPNTSHPCQHFSCRQQSHTRARAPTAWSARCSAALAAAKASLARPSAASAAPAARPARAFAAAASAAASAARSSMPSSPAEALSARCSASLSACCSEACCALRAQCVECEHSHPAGNTASCRAAEACAPSAQVFVNTAWLAPML